MRKTTIIAATVLGLCSGTAYSQQIPQYSQYMINDYLLNPAVTGMHDYFEVKSTSRFNWVGINDAPRTFALSVHGPLQSLKMGLGGAIFSDVTGPTSRNGIYVSYAYHLKLSKSLKLGMGLSLGLLQYNIDGTKITLYQNGDPVLPPAMMTVYTADMTFGLNLVHKNFNVGFSFPQLIGNELKFLENQDPVKSGLARHYMLMGGYTFRVGKFAITPNALLKYVTPTPLQFDIGAKFMYNDMVWLGATYRHGDAVSMMVGTLYKGWLMAAYAYDYNTTSLINYSGGSHEIMIGVRFKAIKKKSKDGADAVESTTPAEVAPEAK